MIKFGSQKQTWALLKAIATLVAGILFVLPQSAHAVEHQPRLAILSDSAFGQAGDLLSVEFSQQTNIVLLERGEIGRILQEQKLMLKGISVKDSIKLGQILGADGLLTLGTIQTGTNAHLVTTLIAVKQGVILDAMESPWPMKDAGEWTKLVRSRFQPLLPKLSVLPKDALPISVLNLRSAANSPESKQFEHQLTELLLNRLTHEKELFILERRKLDKLTTEKEFAKAEDSLFWNGSYLLEGTVDKNGFSKEVATITARLAPPGGGTPVEMEVSGKRDQPEQLIEQLARRVMESLKKQSSSPEWKPAAEASQYYEDAKWALKWKLNKEAQAAAESAWALGKRDMDCALVRVQAYLADVSPDPHFQPGTVYGIKDHQGCADCSLEEIKRTQKPAGLVWYVFPELMDYLIIYNPPNEEQLDRAIHLLDLYYNFGQTLSPEEPRLGSPWYRLGVNSLTAASQVLQHYNLVPESQKGVEDKLAELRSMARAVSEYILKSPSVRDSYWVGNRMATHDELYRYSEPGENIFKCKLLWGPLWQETPEDIITLYRGLMSSDVFCCIHKDFWFRNLQHQRLPVWKREDTDRLKPLWNRFVQELENSTNSFLKLEGKSVRLAQVNNSQEMEDGYKSLVSLLFDSREAILANNVELLCNGWDLSYLIMQMGREGSSPTKEKLQQQYFKEHRSTLEAIDQEFRARLAEKNRLREVQAALEKKKEAFEKQKEILRRGSYEPDFLKLFQFSEYTPAQAAELEPLLSSFKSNLLAQASKETGLRKIQIEGQVSWVGNIVQKKVGDILRPPVLANTKTESPRQTNAATPAFKQTTGSETLAPALMVTKFCEIPVKKLPGTNASNVRVFAHRIRDGKLLLDLRYEEVNPYAPNPPYRAAVGIWDPQNGDWQIIPYPPSDGEYRAPVGFMGETDRGLYFELFENALYVSDWKGIKRYNLASKQWETLSALEPNLSQLFNFDGHLYGANDQSIFEILDHGHSTRILASTRRRPAVTALDSVANLNSPTLFPGPGKTIRTSVEGKLYTWDEKEWKEDLNLGVDRTPEVFEEGTLLRTLPRLGKFRVWFLPHATRNANFCWEEPVNDGRGNVMDAVGWTANNELTPIWKHASQLFMAMDAGLAMKSNLYFFKYDCGVTNIERRWQLIENNGHHAFLYCLENESKKVLKINLKFDLEHGKWPAENYPPMPWMVHIAESMVIGRPDGGGFWIIPETQLETAINREKGPGLRKKAERLAGMERMQRELIARYDQDHDGVLNPAEQELAVNDIRWLEVNWPLIDVNGNGYLDAQDNLSIFDANKNGKAEEAEISAMETIQTIISANLVERLDENNDGGLDLIELKLMRTDERNVDKQRFVFDQSLKSWADHDTNHDGRLDKAELEPMITALTLRSIHMARPGQFTFRTQITPNWKDPEVRNMLKAAVENLWREPLKLGSAR
jgi:TolB-like protein